MKKVVLFFFFLLSVNSFSQSLIIYNEIQSKKLLLNKTLYTVSNWCHEKVGTDTKFMQLEKKYIPVVVFDIKQDDKKRIEVYFRTEENEIHFVKILLYDKKNQLYDAWGLEFEDFFSFENPREKYPNISDSNWELIQNSEVQIGMTKQECILSLGEPKSKNKTITQYVVHEQWVYYTGYLYFDNDKLTTIQK